MEALEIEFNDFRLKINTAKRITDRVSPVKGGNVVERAMQGQHTGAALLLHAGGSSTRVMDEGQLTFLCWRFG